VASGDKVDNLFTEIVDHRRQNNRKDGHDHQRLAGCLARTFGIELAEAKATTTVVPRSMAAKNDITTMLKLSASPTPPSPLSPASSPGRCSVPPSAERRYFPGR
jgi:hypothetical protein